MSLININNLTFRYEGSLNNVFDGVSFNIDTSWKLGLIGRNGKGKQGIKEEGDYRDCGNPAAGSHRAATVANGDGVQAGGSGSGACFRI